MPPPHITEMPAVSPTGMVTSLDNPSPRGPVPARDGPFQAGQQIGSRYTIIRLLGIGGMGAVYQAFDHELGVAVAIKVIRPAAQADATAAKDLEQRFKRELVLARQVTHKYVVRIHDLGEIDGIKYLTMPFVEGETLAQVLRRENALSIPRTIKIAQQIAQGLAAAHEKGVIHRDLKPENIMIEKASESPLPGGGGDALIMDFGIARSMESGATQTAAGSVIGTLEYMAPEQAQGAKVDQRADQYAFGLMLYDMLLGRQRLANRDNPMSELLGRLTTSPPAPRTVKPEVPEPLDQIVIRCLQLTPAARFATTADLVQALDRLTPDGHIRTDSQQVVTAVQAKPRPKWQLALASIVILMLGGTTAWLLLNGNASPPTASSAREPISVLVADFNNKTGDEAFNGVVEQALGLGIEGASFISTFPRRDALRAATAAQLGDKMNEQTARLVAVREGLSLVLAGDIEARGSGYHITARALAPNSDGAPLHTVEGDATGKASLLETVGVLAGKVRTALGDTAVPKGGPAANETFTAANLEAASAYVQAQELQIAGKVDEAIARYQEAIRLDPELGRAYSGIAGQYQNLGRMEDAGKYYKEALSRIDRMTEREKYRTRGIYYLFTRNAQGAVKEYSALLQAFPADNVGLAMLALARFYERDMAQALDVGRKAAASFPHDVTARMNLALYAMYAGQFDTAIAESDEVLKLNSARFKAFVARALSELGLGRSADAIKTFEKAKRVSAAGASYAFAGLADVALYNGRTTDAIALLKEGIAADTAAKNAISVSLKRIALAEAYLARGDTAAAAREAEQAVFGSSSIDVMVTGGLVLARAGKAAAALKLGAGLANRLEADPQAYGRLLRAEASLAQGQPRAALDHAREAQKLADTWLGHLLLARVYLALNAFTEATSELDVAIKRQGEATALMLDEVPTFRYFPSVYYYKGLAQDGLKSPAAKASFEAFLKIKEDGDEIGGLVADARKRVQ